MNVGTQDVGVSITAAGTTQATATLIINGIGWITTAPANSGVLLNFTNVGTSQTVYNGGANPVKVYPPLGAQINALPANTGMILGTNTACTFWYLNSAQVIGNLSA